MKIYIENHSFHYEIENLVRVFFPNEKLEVIKDHPDEICQEPCILTRLADAEAGCTTVYVAVAIDGNKKEASQKVFDTCSETEDECERVMAVLLYEILSEQTKVYPPWGILTGVRPVKLLRALTDAHGSRYAQDYFIKKLLVSPAKAQLAAETERVEREILTLSKKHSFSLYISVPFCPSRCSYCSFVSQSVEKAAKLIEPYTQLLCREIAETGRLANRLGLVLETVYIGGGTPTTLSAGQLSRIMEAIHTSFDMQTCREFTVEAGRPDTITYQKLLAIRDGGAERISINPQSLNDKILAQIGRRHTAKQTLEAFSLARQAGFGHINTDLIAGLPTESVQSFQHTLDTLLSLSPESITVHTLAMKKSSRLTEEGMRLYREDAATAADMHALCALSLPKHGYQPYYLYRQSRMVGNLENVGWSQKGHEGLYNVFIMDETHTILGCGAGAVTKLKQPSGTYLERIFNYKYPYEYISHFEEMLKRKERLEPFYEHYA